MLFVVTIISVLMVFILPSAFAETISNDDGYTMTVSDTILKNGDTITVTCKSPSDIVPKEIQFYMKGANNEVDYNVQSLTVSRIVETHDLTIELICQFKTNEFQYTKLFQTVTIQISTNEFFITVEPTIINIGETVIITCNTIHYNAVQSIQLIVDNKFVERDLSEDLGAVSFSYTPDDLGEYDIKCDFREADADDDHISDSVILTVNSIMVDSPPNGDTTTDDSNGGCSDCTPPTLGLDTNYKRIVDRGFSYNGNPVQVEFWHTPYPLITALVGNLNIVQITVYENSGKSYLDMVQFGIGAKEIGEPLNDVEILIEVYFESIDDNNIGVENVIIKDRDNLLDTYATIAFVDVVKCMDDSQTKECVQVILFYSYREPTLNNVMVVSVSDKERNTQDFYFNDGVEIVGESLNEAPTYELYNKKTNQQTKDLTLTLTRIDKVNHIWVDKYDVEYLQVSENRFDRITPKAPLECNDPPLSEINVPNRNNCHFRALAIWK